MKKIDFLIAPETREFVRICRRYFEYLEKLPDEKISDFWIVQLRLLSGIYAGVLLLPQIDAPYSSEVEKFVTEREYNNIFANLATYMGGFDKFPDFNDLSHPGSAKVVETSLSEILTDIYQELKDFVLLYESDNIEDMNDAIVECLDTFGRYWGVKLLSATRIIHVNLYQHRYAEQKKASRQYEGIEDEDFDEVNIEDFDIEDFDIEDIDFDDGMD